MRIVLAVLLATTAVARADHAPAFAAHMGATGVKDVVGFETTAGDFPQILIGRFTATTYTMAGLVLVRCTGESCRARRVDFGASDEIAVLGIVDLEGAPTALPAGRRTGKATGFAKLLGGRMRFPALVLQTQERSGKNLRTKVHLVSLLEADRATVVMHDTAFEQWAGRPRVHRSYRLDRLAEKSALDLIAKDHNAGICDPPEWRYKLDGRHYRTADAPKPEGCDPKK